MSPSAGGWHGLLGKSADLVAEGAYVDTSSNDGYCLAGGLRWHVSERLRVAGLWEFTRRVAAGASYDFGDDASTARVFGRFYLRKNWPGRASAPRSAGGGAQVTLTRSAVRGWWNEITMACSR